ncbi:MAG: hypothetical protein D6704_09435 [Nitrospirae bacterium]|nr:MAG: hypothetical protein D6704_09435 [Nitrospirota bacterium]
MRLQKLYENIYQRFFEQRNAARGYNFQQSPQGSALPSSMTPQDDGVKWWTVDRPRRLRKVLQERDRLQQEILAIRHQSPSSSPPRASQQ